MISRFINIFKKTDGDEQRAFQGRVLKILREIQPDKNFSPSEDPLTLNLGDKVLGLTNLRSNFLLSSKTESDLRTFVTEYILNVLPGLDVTERTELGWVQESLNLMPQLMPVDFLEKLDLVSFPFAGQVVIGFVIDAEKTYSYVSKDDIKRWDVDETKIFDLALENLNERTNGIEASGAPGPNSLLVINSMDSFDAVRIISPDLQNHFGEVIGRPFYFGVPNRDFLICWTKNTDAEFQNRMRAQIAIDFEERPYPLSPSVFEVSENGDITQVEAGTIDPRAAQAESN